MAKAKWRSSAVSSASSLARHLCGARRALTSLTYRLINRLLSRSPDALLNLSAAQRRKSSIQAVRTIVEAEDWEGSAYESSRAAARVAILLVRRRPQPSLQWPRIDAVRTKLEQPLRRTRSRNRKIHHLIPLHSQVTLMETVIRCRSASADGQGMAQQSPSALIDTDSLPPADIIAAEIADDLEENRGPAGPHGPSQARRASLRYPQKSKAPPCHTQALDCPQNQH
jgi:hypothetical protein